MTKHSNALAIAIQYHQAGKLQSAGEIYKQVLQANPNQPDALYLFGVLAHDVGNEEIAIEFIRRAIQLKGDSAEASYNLGGAYSNLKRNTEAIACYRQALTFNPSFAEAHFNLGNVLRRIGELSEATDCYQRTIGLKPDFVDGHVNLGLALTSQGQHEQGIVSYFRALALAPGDAKVHSNLLMALHCCTGMTLATLSEAHAEFDRMHGAVLKSDDSPPVNRVDRENRIRLGFVSADLGQHPVGYFTILALENIDPQSFELFCYFDRIDNDELTRRFRSCATQWRDVVTLNDEQLVEQIKADQIDILFDLAGHTANNRLLAFARKPAAIQVTWAGYTGTTGLNAMDYLIADRFHVPVGAEQYYQERVMRMPDGYVCYDPPAYAPSVSSLPALRHQYVTFGCFNNPGKITAETIRVWSDILKRIPESRLVLKYKGWNDRRFVQKVADAFAVHEVDVKRLEFLGQSSHADLLAEYNRIDVALDTFPYSGGLTTCEALWMGVPVVTCPGETFASRHSLSHLSNTGLTETIADCLDNYVEIAVSLATNLPHLAELRASLRERMASSPLCDGRRFATNLAIQVHEAWARLHSNI
jgi:predicted O-linked N-acetylglucosamine transferase (SPINDLY family)